MAARSLDRGTLERRTVGSGRVLEEVARAVVLETTSLPDPWPTRPFPPEPDPATAIGGLLRIDVIGERAIRVRHVMGDRLRDGAQDIIVGELDRPATEITRDAGRAAELRTARMQLTVSLDPFEMRLVDTARRCSVRIGGPDRNYFRVGDSIGTGIGLDTADRRRVATETFSIPVGGTVHGFGESFIGFDKLGQTLDLEVHDAMGVHTPRMYKPVPFFVTTGGYGLFVNTTAATTAWIGSRAADVVQLAIDDDVLDYVVFVGSVREVVADYTALTGRAPMPPDWTFGWWQSRASYVSADETLGVVRDMRAAGFPVDVIHLDTAWFATDWLCDLEFAPERFPDPEAYCAALRDLGVHLSLWHMPYLVTGTRLHDRLAGVDGFVKDATGRPYDIQIHFVQGYSGPVHAIDWTNPAAVEVMRSEYARLFTTGASVMKVDFGEELPADAVYADGTPGHRMHNRYPLLYQRAVHEATAAATGDPVTWVRSAWAGAQRYPIHWGGDAPPDWSMMAADLHGGLSLGLSGFTFWSSDIGGTGELPDDELLVRWLQLGALLSHARVHGDGIREPHRWSAGVAELARRWIELRYRLLPYILGSARAAAAEGLPFARPLLLDFQDDPTTWTIGDEFLCGESLLVAPILEPGGRRRVYLPPIRWYDWLTGEPVDGGSWFDVEHGLATMPMYLCEGAIVPMGPWMAYVGERPADPLTVSVAPLTHEGETTFETNVAGAELHLLYRFEGDIHELRVEGAPGEVAVDALGDVSIELVIER
jgi:alpha-D-xyloside xylohydrolase